MPTILKNLMNQEKSQGLRHFWKYTLCLALWAHPISIYWSFLHTWQYTRPRRHSSDAVLLPTQGSPPRHGRHFSHQQAGFQLHWECHADSPACMLHVRGEPSKRWFLCWGVGNRQACCGIIGKSTSLPLIFFVWKEEIIITSLLILQGCYKDQMKS